MAVADECTAARAVADECTAVKAVADGPTGCAWEAPDCPAGCAVKVAAAWSTGCAWAAADCPTWVCTAARAVADECTAAKAVANERIAVKAVADGCTAARAVADECTARVAVVADGLMIWLSVKLTVTVAVLCHGVVKSCGRHWSSGAGCNGGCWLAAHGCRAAP